MKWLAILFAIVALAFTGCSTSASQTDDSAVGVVRQFIDAVSRGDGAAVAALYDPECPTYLYISDNLQLEYLLGADVVGWMSSVLALQSLPDFQLEVQDVRVVSESERECTVRLTFTYGGTHPILGPRSETVATDLHLVKHQETWKLWDNGPSRGDLENLG